jgi:hypothetical protein
MDDAGRAGRGQQPPPRALHQARHRRPITAVLFFPAAPLWGFKKGKPAVVPAGTRYTVFVSGDTAVKGKAAPAAPAAPAQ